VILTGHGDKEAAMLAKRPCWRRALIESAHIHGRPAILFQFAREPGRRDESLCYIIATQTGLNDQAR
jgi:hypothetical protein